MASTLATRSGGFQCLRDQQKTHSTMSKLYNFRGVPMAHPPVSWRRDVTDPDERQAQWVSVTWRQRHRAMYNAEAVDRKIADANTAVELGVATHRQQTIAERGHLRPKGYATPEDQAIARAKDADRSVNRESASILRFRLERVHGCTIQGCPLSSPEPSDRILSLFEFDHINRDTKIAYVTKLKGIERDAEFEKTQVLCLWHHFEKTRDERNYRANSNRAERVQCILGQEKNARGCEHPCHSAMAYADIVPRAEHADSTRSTGFFHVSHIRREHTHPVIGNSRAMRHIADLKAGTAVVHCCFCHRLYTLCENAARSQRPYSDREFAVLLKQSPAFVQHFNEATAGYDWSIQVERARQRSSVSAKKRPKRKYKVEPEPSEADVPSDWDEAAYIAADMAHMKAKAARAVKARVV